MYKSVNKVILVGSLGADPTVRYMSNGKPVVTFSVATTYFYKNKSDGTFKSRVEWHKVTLYDKTNDFINRYFKKGCKVYVEGFLRTDKWQDKDGILRYFTGIIATDIQSLNYKDQRFTNGSVTRQKNSSDYGEDEDYDELDGKDNEIDDNRGDAQDGVFKDGIPN